MQPFKSDGCSGGLSAAWRAFGALPPWEGCCREHDRSYWQGGSARDRRLADARLLGCVAQSGHPLWAIAMWAAVRLGGHPYWPTPWRWGYGHDFPHAYSRKHGEGP